MRKALGILFASLLPTLAFAEEAAVVATEAGMGNGAAIGLAAGIGLALAVFGGAMAQGRICAAAMEGIARNPNAQKNMFVSMIIGLVLIESLVIYMLVVAFNLLGKF